MLRLITEKSALVLAVLNFGIATPAHSAVINYDFKVAWNETDATLLNEQANGYISPGERTLTLVAYGNSQPAYAASSQDANFAQATVADGSFTLRAEADAIPASFDPLTSASVPADANANATSSLLGPIPVPSLMWIGIGAIAALAGLSRGTRGIHESV